MAVKFSQVSRRVFQVYLLITIYFAFATCDKFHPPATKYDIDYLQSQLDAKTTQIENIHIRINKLESLTSSYTQQQNDQDMMISGLKSNLSIAMNAINQLQNNPNDLEYRVRGLEKRVGNTENSISGLGIEIVDLSSSFTSTVTKINKTLNHFHEVNQIWKSNFRNINITFHNIKKKVNFAIPTFRI